MTFFRKQKAHFYLPDRKILPKEEKKGSRGFNFCLMLIAYLILHRMISSMKAFAKERRINRNLSGNRKDRHGLFKLISTPLDNAKQAQATRRIILAFTAVARPVCHRHLRKMLSALSWRNVF